MKKIILKIKNNKEPVRYRRRKSSGSGFVILFAGTISAILLSIALGVANIAFKEVKFRTSDKDTNAAFFAADTGAECALFNDKTTGGVFGPQLQVTCNDSLITIIEAPASFWSFTISQLGSEEQGCAKVTVDKTGLGTQIISNGYNDGGNVSGSCLQSSNTVERQIELNY